MTRGRKEAQGVELKKCVLCMVGKGRGGAEAVVPGRCHPPSAAGSSPVLSPVPDSSKSRACCHLLHPGLVSPGASCQAGDAGRSGSPGATGNTVPPFCVCGLPYISLAPEAVVEKGSPC